MNRDFHKLSTHRAQSAASTMIIQLGDYCQPQLHEMQMHNKATKENLCLGTGMEKKRIQCLIAVEHTCVKRVSFEHLLRPFLDLENLFRFNNAFVFYFISLVCLNVFSFEFLKNSNSFPKTAHTHSKTLTCKNMPKMLEKTFL